VFEILITGVDWRQGHRCRTPRMEGTWKKAPHDGTNGRNTGGRTSNYCV